MCYRAFSDWVLDILKFSCLFPVVGFVSNLLEILPDFFTKQPSFHVRNNECESMLPNFHTTVNVT